MEDILNGPILPITMGILDSPEITKLPSDIAGIYNKILDEITRLGFKFNVIPPLYDFLTQLREMGSSPRSFSIIFYIGNIVKRLINLCKRNSLNTDTLNQIDNLDNDITKIYKLINIAIGKNYDGQGGTHEL